MPDRGTNRRSQSELKAGLNSEGGGNSGDKKNPLALDLEQVINQERSAYAHEKKAKMSRMSERSQRSRRSSRRN